MQNSRFGHNMIIPCIQVQSTIILRPYANNNFNNNDAMNWRIHFLQTLKKNNNKQTDKQKKQ